jgi:hypothetical protein
MKKKVRTYGRTVYINFDPKCIKKGLFPSKILQNDGYVMSVIQQTV